SSKGVMVDLLGTEIERLTRARIQQTKPPPGQPDPASLARLAFSSHVRRHRGPPRREVRRGEPPCLSQGSSGGCKFRPGGETVRRRTGEPDLSARLRVRTPVRAPTAAIGPGGPGGPRHGTGVSGAVPSVEGVRQG